MDGDGRLKKEAVVASEVLLKEVLDKFAQKV